MMVQVRSRRIWPRLVAALLLAVLQPTVCVAQGGVPAEIEVHLSEAEEAYFDGAYDEALRRLDKVETWLGNPINQKKLATIGCDHSLVRAMVIGMRAEVLSANGERGKARAALTKAETTLRNRRTALVARKVFPPVMWQYEAFLCFVRGDLVQPLPDFGLSDEPRMPDGVKRLFLERGDPRNAIIAYEAASEALSAPQAWDGGDAFRWNRLQGRLYTSLARATVLKAGTPTVQDVNDAAGFLERAEAAFSKNELWKQCIKQEHFGEIPHSFKDIDKCEGDLSKKLALKRKFAQTISDWVGLQLLNVELSAFQEHADNGVVNDLVASTEQRYDRIIGFLKAQYPEAHPRVQDVRLSRARWFAAVARSSVNPRETQASLLRDCLLELEAVSPRAAGDVAQKQVVELWARFRLLDLDREEALLEAGERAAYQARILDLQSQLESQVAGGRSHDKSSSVEAAGASTEEDAEVAK